MQACPTQNANLPIGVLLAGCSGLVLSQLLQRMIMLTVLEFP